MEIIMNEELKKYYTYLQSVNADVPDTFESFAKTLSDEKSAKQYYDYLKSNNFDAPDTYESFSSTLGLKKKEFSVLESMAQGRDLASEVRTQISNTPLEERGTPQQPSESVEQPTNIDQ
jgi:CHASE3 domain sensor protein